DAEVGGTSSGTVEFQYFLDPANTPFGTGVMLADFPGLTDAYTGSSNGNFNITAPYSMTVSAKIHHDGAGTTGFDSQLTLTPPHFQPPTIQCAGDRDLSCNPESIPSCDTNSISVTASCGVSNITCAVAGPDIVTGCVHERDLVYTVTDNCGLSTSCTQHIYWTADTTPPSFTLSPDDVNLGCNPTVIPDCDLSKASATDDCGRVVITCGSVDSSDGCSHMRTITYTATDSCNNKSTAVQHITWTVNTTAPTITQCASDRNLGCNPTSIPTGTNSLISANDDCGSVTVTNSYVDSSSGCGRTRTITYVATDACGNQSTCVQHVTWTVNTTAPTITRCAADRNLGCNPTSIPIGTNSLIAANDDCGSVTVTNSYVDSSSGCGHTRTITYVATDACGNQSTCIQRITWTANNTAPTFTSSPSDMTVTTCDANCAIATYSGTATDDCGTATVTFSPPSGSCLPAGTNTVTATATDACGNKTIRTFKVVVQAGLGCYITFTPGGWGAPPNGGNVANLLKATFSSVYPSGFKVGGNNTITLTSQLAIQNYLPSGGTPGALKKSYTNPTSTEAGEFGSQVTALKLNCDYSTAGLFKVGLTTLHIAPGYTLAGQTVAQVLTTCQKVLGGGALPPGVTISQLTTLCSGINGNYDGGLQNNGVLVP
ncbi:MAG: HYR domain-containing protein, partial [Limisphaerales bacterium]